MITNTPENLAQLQKEQLELFIRKNHDYGNSFERSLDEDGLIVAKIRLSDKLSRFSTLVKSDSKVKDESIRDTLMDFATYAMMTVMFLDGDKITCTSTNPKWKGVSFEEILGNQKK